MLSVVTAHPATYSPPQKPLPEHVTDGVSDALPSPVSHYPTFISRRVCSAASRATSAVVTHRRLTRRRRLRRPRPCRSLPQSRDCSSLLQRSEAAAADRPAQPHPGLRVRGLDDPEPQSARATADPYARADAQLDRNLGECSHSATHASPPV